MPARHRCSSRDLNELIAAGIAARKLSFTTDANIACANADVLWLCYDTPVNDKDESDVKSVLASLRRALAHLPEGALVLISSQLPVGTCAKLEKEFPQFHFACSPENLRLGKAIDAFEKAERVIVGIRNDCEEGVAGGIVQTIRRADYFHAHRVGGDGQARAEFLPRAVHHLHQ